MNPFLSVIDFLHEFHKQNKTPCGIHVIHTYQTIKMGSLEEIYWNMAKKQWKVGAHYAIMPS